MMNKHLVTYLIYDKDNEYEDYEVVVDAQDYSDKELIANYFSFAESEKYENDCEKYSYSIMTGQRCKVQCIQTINDNDENTLRKLGVIL